MACEHAGSALGATEHVLFAAINPATALPGPSVEGVSATTKLLPFMVQIYRMSVKCVDLEVLSFTSECLYVMCAFVFACVNLENDFLRSGDTL